MKTENDTVRPPVYYHYDAAYVKLRSLPIEIQGAIRLHLKKDRRWITT